MREFLRGLELDGETIDTIMAEYGKNVQGLREQLNEYKTKSSESTDRIKQLEEEAKQYAEMQKELDGFKSAKTEAETNKKILEVIGDKKFTSDYAKRGLLNDMKNEMAKEENKNVGIQEIFNNLVKDKTDIFANPNQFTDMPSMGNTDNLVSKEAFDKMSYKERIELKQSNPELFSKYNN